MRKLGFWLICSILITLVACKNEVKTETKATTTAPVEVNDEISKWPKLEGGYNYKQHTKNNTPKPKAGDYVYFDWSIVSNGQILKSTYDSPQSPVKAKLSDITGDKISPSMAALKTMSVGDSVTIVVRGEERLKEYRKNAISDATGDIVYNITLRAIKSEAEYMKDLEKDVKLNAERTKGMIPEKKETPSTAKDKSTKTTKTSKSPKK